MHDCSELHDYHDQRSNAAGAASAWLEWRHSISGNNDAGPICVLYLFLGRPSTPLGRTWIPAPAGHRWVQHSPGPTSIRARSGGQEVQCEYSLVYKNGSHWLRVEGSRWPRVSARAWGLAPWEEPDRGPQLTLTHTYNTTRERRYELREARHERTARVT